MPRTFSWITTLSPAGVVNLAPHSMAGLLYAIGEIFGCSCGGSEGSDATVSLPEPHPHRAPPFQHPHATQSPDG